MFRTAGYYRGVNCPFFSSGLCDRPYCHFRHVKSDHNDLNEDVNNKTASTSKEASSYLDKLSNGQFPLTSEAIKSFSKERETGAADHAPKQLVNKYTGEPIEQDASQQYECASSGVTNEVDKYTVQPVEFNKYTGEPIYHDDNASGLSSDKRWSESIIPSSTPTYNPTPLSELRKANHNKYSLSGSASTSSQEYDPESNFSTTTKLNHVPIPQISRPSYKIKSHDASSAIYRKSVLKRPRVPSFFDAKFSSDDEENESSAPKDVRSNLGDKVAKYHLKDVNYFEKLLDGPKDSKVKKDRVKVDSDDSMDSLDEDVDVTPLLEKCRRRSQSGGTDSTEEKTDTKSEKSGKDQTSVKDKCDAQDTKLGSGKQKVREDSKDRTEKSGKKKFKTDRDSSQDRSHEICDKIDKKNHSASSSHSKASHEKSSQHEKSSHEKSSHETSSQDKSSHEKSSHETSSHEKSSHEKSTQSSQSSKTNSSVKSSLHKLNNSKSTHISGKSSRALSSQKSSQSKSIPSTSSQKLSSHHTSSQTTSHKGQQIISKHGDFQRKSSTEESKNVSKVKLCNSEKSKDSTTTSSVNNHHHEHARHASADGHSSEYGHEKNSGPHSSKSSRTKNCNKDKTNGSQSLRTTKDNKESVNGSQSLGTKRNKEKLNGSRSLQTKHEKETLNGSKEKDLNSSTSDKKKGNSVDGSRRRSSTEASKQKIVDFNVDLFGADSEDETDSKMDDVENSVEPAESRDGHASDSDHDMVAYLNDSDYSDDDVDRYDECLQIFQENKGDLNKANKKKSSTETTNEMDAPPAPTGKKRTARKDTEKPVKKKILERPKSKMSPAEVMHNRFLQLQKRAREEAEQAKNETSSSTSKHPLLTGGKKRSAHHPSTSKKNDKTVITTASRTEKRKARTLNVSNLARPTIPSEFGSKIPSNIRQRYLNFIIDECLKICDSEQEAYNKGQEEEAAVYKKASSKTVYLNLAVHAIKRLRTEQAGPSSSKKPKPSAFQLSHEQILGGKNATKTTFTVNRSGGGTKLQETNFRGAELYKRLSRYMLTEELMKENGFPRPSPTLPGSAVFYVERRKKIQTFKPTNYEKLCTRCGNVFIVYPNGTYAKKEECSFHWGKAWKKRVAGMIDTRYTCCEGDLSSDGCQEAKAHVHETNKWDLLTGYMKTFPCSPPCDGDYGVFAMDCEMVYTKLGIELARITVTDPENDCVYETLVKPDTAVIDYNTRFSGITEKDLRDVTTTLHDVQAVLLSLFSDRTIVMGHSLESDFSAVRLLHNTVVDTSVVFPHKMGPPYKRALKTLMAEYLKKIIQDDVGGHDSKEDSTSCMELMHYKLKEDARKEPRRS